ncbi:hypothetical protein ACE41A_00115 [Bacillus cytotoxicus]|uniref:hypothetical protein n=1 Tax=Bacillus cytotoxicus TaxID=580165 RepID=UPI002AB8AB1B|nr:hypothetical protein [Bacillus cytotoxicus]
MNHINLELSTLKFIEIAKKNNWSADELNGTVCNEFYAEGMKTAIELLKDGDAVSGEFKEVFEFCPREYEDD